MAGNGWKEGRRGYLVVFNVLLYRVNEFSLVLLYRTLNRHQCRSENYNRQRTFGLTKSALKLEKTLNISFALRAVPSLS